MFPPFLYVGRSVLPRLIYLSHPPTHQDEDCGFYIADLSGEGKDACATSADGCDVVMPEPLGGVSGDGYRVRISEVGTENARCSSEFYLVASEDAPGPGEMGGPTVVVVEPNSNSVAVAGDAYTIEVSHC